MNKGCFSNVTAASSLARSHLTLHSGSLLAKI